ncbi:hypothetical protein BHE74_00002112 [Ensete ventricosum]|nr:hypothetical protein BHE74_00002112 [Ensete ventricosum]RZR85004.1 hypothetical protein BHM03_00011931 [Ensete ventricosum]
MLGQKLCLSHTTRDKRRPTMVGPEVVPESHNSEEEKAHYSGPKVVPESRNSREENAHYGGAKNYAQVTQLERREGPL